MPKLRSSIEYRRTRAIPLPSLLELSRAIGWSAAEKPQRLGNAIANSDFVVSAWDADALVGLGNALSDGHLVVYYPHLLVAPSHQGRGIGRRLVAMLQERYTGLHQQVLVAEGEAITFYGKCGFAPAGRTRSMWIYDGKDH
jgi:GNAT superfamily N-acetyltransferase